MKIKKAITDFLLSFFCITACITILTAVLGTLYMPDVTFTSKAFFSPVIFGFLSALTGYIVSTFHCSRLYHCTYCLMAK